MKLRLIAIFALVFTLFACDREYYVEEPYGTWQMSDVKIIARSPMGETIEATSLKELLQGTMRILKTYMPDEDFSDYETFIAEMEDTPFSFTEDQTIRFNFLKDGTFKGYTKNKEGVWEAGEDGGEYSYAGTRLTLYGDNEDGTVTTIPCTVVRLTNKTLILQMSVADLIGLSGGTSLSGVQSGEDDGESAMMALSMLRIIDLNTELTFNKVRK